MIMGGITMGCGVAKSNQFQTKKSRKAVTSIQAAVLIQRWYRQYVARKEMRRRYTWNIFQSIEYSGEQAQIKLYNFLGYLMDNFTPTSTERNFVSHIFRENEVCHDVEWERYFCYRNIEVPEIYSGPHMNFPLTADQVTALVEAFRNKRQLHSRYVLQILLETWKLLRLLPNISRISTCHSKEITICGDLHGQLEDLLLIFYKNGMPSLERPYVFNGDFVDRGKDSMEILLILFAFLLVYPNDVHLNRGNHEDHIVNLRYGFTKEVLGKYQMHGKRILKLLQMIFSWLPLATVIDQKVLILHGGISNTTDLCDIARVDRHKYVSALKPPKKRAYHPVAQSSVESEVDDNLSSTKNNQRRASFGLRDCFHSRSLQDLSSRVPRTTEQEKEVQRRQSIFIRGGFSQSQKELNYAPASSESQGTTNTADTSVEDWGQILDLLWSDPMPNNGCMPNEVRGGGCYWGPDVTQDFLSRHNMQLIIRSHECKQEGYEFCHNRRVLTLFSASNYYEVGSNRGAYVKLGPDLVPYLIQYQASSMTRELSLRKNVGKPEHSALKVLREQLFAHKSDLVRAFQEFDKDKTGLISLNDWVIAVESVLCLGLPWRMLFSQLITCKAPGGMFDYQDWFQELSIKEPQMENVDHGLLETLYRHRSTLETIFRLVDFDNSGLITMEDFRQTWKLLSAFLKMEITDEAISDLSVTIDTNQDGNIDIDEFMEAFRLTDKKSRLERGKSMFMGTSNDLTKLEGDPDIQ
ncbi:serine/threonine-protein phosphatase with EF-hands 2 isoform X2 [Esox lucius]|uniref:Serine/threonine-protein phosphatase with EF-hands n=1 Tax=Esox lucius TaxID=8010 RepID=A0A3P9A2Y0_ESOLU|nr:serine/threonine-protein phosphatase with EF-hands 2 isoform X2 [Esox lucius]